MQQDDVHFPDEFADLESYATTWALPTSDERHHRRQTTPLADIRAFYDAMRPRLGAIFDYLDGFDLAAMPPAAERLLQLSLGFVEAALAVELFNEPGVTDAPYPHGFRVVSELYPPRAAEAAA